MQLEDYFNFLAPNDIRLKGTRVGIETILYDFIHRGRTPEKIAATYPSLTLEQVYATITYYLHNQAAVSQYLTNLIEHGERLRAEQEHNPPPGLRWLQQQDTQRMLAEAKAKYELHE